MLRTIEELNFENYSRYTKITIHERLIQSINIKIYVYFNKTSNSVNGWSYFFLLNVIGLILILILCMSLVFTNV